MTARPLSIRLKPFIVFAALMVPLALFQLRGQLWRLEAVVLQYQLDRLSAAEDAKHPDDSPRPVGHEELEVAMHLQQIRMAHDPVFAEKHREMREKLREHRRSRAPLQELSSSLTSPESHATQNIARKDRTNKKQRNQIDEIAREHKPSAAPTILAIDQATNSGFVYMKLNPEVSIQVPDSWKVFEKSANALISQIALARVSNETEAKKIEANDNRTGRTTLIRLTCVPSVYYGTLTFHAYDVCHLAPDEAQEIMSDPEGRNAIRHAFLSKLQPIAELINISEEAVAFTSVSGFPAVSISYVRDSITGEGKVAVRTTHIYAKSCTYSFATSYGLTEKDLIKPILDYSLRSIVIEGSGRQPG